MVLKQHEICKFVPVDGTYRQRTSKGRCRFPGRVAFRRGFERCPRLLKGYQAATHCETNTPCALRVEGHVLSAVKHLQLCQLVIRGGLCVCADYDAGGEARSTRGGTVGVGIDFHEEVGQLLACQILAKYARKCIKKLKISVARGGVGCGEGCAVRCEVCGWV